MSAGFSITIGAVDRVSAPLDAINKRMAAARAPFERLQKSLDRFRNLSGLNAVGAGLSRMAGFARSAFGHVSRLLAPLGAITGAASIAGIAKLVEGWASFGSELGFASSRLGIAADRLQSLQGAATLAGASGNAMTSGLQHLGQTLYDAIGGRAPEATALFNQLGIAIDAGGRHARSAADVLPELADRIAGIRDPFAQAQVATAAFGGAGEALLPFLKQGAAGLADLTDRARRYGVLNQAAVEQANRLRMGYAGLSLAVTGLVNSIAEKLGPILTPLLNQMAEWIARNREWIATGIGEKVQEFAAYLEKIDWAGLGKSLTDIVGGLTAATNGFGGMKTVVAGLVGIGLASWLNMALGPLGAVIRLLSVIPGAQLATGLAAGGVAAESATRSGIMGVSKARGRTDDQAASDYVAGVTGVNLPDAPPPVLPGPDHSGGFGNIGSFVHRLVHGQDRPEAPKIQGGKPLPGMQKQAYDYFVKQGWTGQQAAGIVANLTEESKLNAGAVGDRGSAYGIGQWHPDRQAIFAKVFGHDIRKSTLSEQLAFYDYELHNTEKGAGKRLAGARTAAEAGAIVSRYDERPAAVDEAAAHRGALAESIYPALSVGPSAQVGDGSGGAQGEAGPNGKAELSVRVAGPPGTKTSLNASGPIWAGAPSQQRIDRAMDSNFGF